MEMTHIGGTLGSAQADKGATVLAAGGGMGLEELAIGATARVVSVSSAGAPGAGEMARRLAELGFLPGEKLRIVARGLMGREPIAVRIGTGTIRAAAVRGRLYPRVAGAFLAPLTSWSPRPVPWLPLIALVGNPNCGKTALFNVLTGSRQKVRQLRRRHGGTQGGVRG